VPGAVVEAQKAITAAGGAYWFAELTVSDHAVAGSSTEDEV
jgi:hypothetical protein